MLVVLGAKYVVEVKSEAVKVANVKRAKIVVECIVEEAIVNGEVVRCLSLGFSWGRSRSINGSLGSFTWRASTGLFVVGEEGIGVRGMKVRC